MLDVDREDEAAEGEAEDWIGVWLIEEVVVAHEDGVVIGDVVSD